MLIREFELAPRYHQALMDWQSRNFPPLSLLQEHWSEHFPGEPPYRLAARVESARQDVIQVGMFKGQPTIQRAADMKGNMLYSALRIIRAQCSTELGSIQQHLQTLDSDVTGAAKFSILRICAEELRHAYQMFWVLSHDASWSQAGVRNVAQTTLDELLAMSTGTHVLDAFNIPFHDVLDNMVFSFLIDRVGKYQLDMQKVFCYAPMAQSMAPMLHEESFHLRTGYEMVRSMAAAAAIGQGRWSLEEVQRRINAWFPRAVEMFGNPDGGQANVSFGFKDRLNNASLAAYTAEVGRLLRRINIAVLQARHADLTREQAERRAEEDCNLLSLPHVDFFRMRGTREAAHQPIDVRGKRLSEPLYWQHLEQALPESLRATGFFAKYRADFIAPALH